MTYNTSSGLLENVETETGNYSTSYFPNSDLPASIVSPDGQAMAFAFTGDTLSSITATGTIKSFLQFDYQTDSQTAAIRVAGADGISKNTQLSYDRDGLLTRIGKISFIRNNVGLIQSSLLGKVSGTTKFDTYAQIEEQSYKVNSKTIFSQEYSRNLANQITEVIEKNSRLNFEYDQMRRLVKTKLNGRVVREYSYDLNGNRIKAISDNGNVISEYDAQDRLVKSGRTEFDYNENGELILKTVDRDNKKLKFWEWVKYFIFHKRPKLDRQKTTEYAYDSFGNLKSVELSDGRKIEYILDGQQRRVGKKVNGKLVQGFVYLNQTQIVGELDANGNLVKQFVYGSKVNIPDYLIYKNKEYRIISDHVGSPRLIVDTSTGKVSDELEFDEFGNLVGNASDLIPFGFAGGIYDKDTKLIMFGARNYDAETGRWTSKDPILFSGRDMNLYGYVLQDPVNLIDPNGKAPLLPALVIGGAAVAAGKFIYDYNTDPIFELEVDTYIDNLFKFPKDDLDPRPPRYQSPPSEKLACNGER